MHVFYCNNNNVTKARREKKENFTKDKKDTYMYNVHKKLMSTFTNMGDIIMHGLKYIYVVFKNLCMKNSCLL